MVRTGFAFYFAETVVRTVRILSSAPKEDGEFYKFKTQQGIKVIEKELGIPRLFEGKDLELYRSIVGEPDGLVTLFKFDLGSLEKHIKSVFIKSNLRKSKRPSRKRSVKSQTKP